VNATQVIDELALATKEQMLAVIAPLLERIAVLEAKAAIVPDLDVVAMKAALLVPKPADGKDAPAVDLEAVATKAASLVPVPQPGRDGKDADPGQLLALQVEVAGLKVALEAQKSMTSAPVDAGALDRVFEDRILPAIKAMAPQPGRDGKDVDMAAVNLAIDGAVTKAVSALPAAKDGQDGQDGQSVDMDLVRKAITDEVARIPVPRDGRDVDPALLETIVAGHVAKAVAALPAAQDGTSVTLDDVAPLVAAEVTKAVSGLPKAADGVGLSDAVISRDGELILTFSDGRTKAVGVVVGANADPLEVKRLIGEAVDAFPRPKDGEPGKDGADGLGFDDLDGVLDDEKGFVLRWSRDGRVKEQIVPVVLDRGVYKPGVLYRKGAAVTAQGSLWIAQEDTRERPADGTGSKFWRLAVKKGRDGRDLTERRPE
jgi:hypothetical protein